LISEDFPTFDRPRKQISGRAGSRRKSAEGKLPTNVMSIRPPS
jgi:hypothetical protein